MSRENYKLTVGLEIHAELNTVSKMFCRCANDPDEQHPNVNVCPVCMGHPGALPTPNKEAILSVVQVGMALGGTTPEYSRFDRKNYFYPDLPKGYQISQYLYPLVLGGSLQLPGTDKSVRVTRVHLEEDTGRLAHAGKDSLVDYNRSSVPLLELVTEPDIANAEEARLFAEEFQLLLRTLGVAEANMEKGEMRVEANISVSKEAGKLGTKVEVKNINSFRAVERAIAYEYERQVAALENGEAIKQETRGWDEGKQKTFSQRPKESAHDYRYFPDPDLPALDFTDKNVWDLEVLRAKLPELPWQKRARFAKEYGLAGDMLTMIVRDNDLAAFFERAISELLEWAAPATPEASDGGRDKEGKREELIKLAVNYLGSDVQALVKEKLASFGELLMTPENFAELIKMAHQGEINSRAAKDVLRVMFETGQDPSDIVEQKGLKQVGDESALLAVAAQVIADNPAAVVDYKGGKEASLQFLVGQMMRLTRGAANPQVAAKLLRVEISATPPPPDL
jgi:aspartyl-tRNA(Asn)/glutamyl-tRNA(Gln) amidotransferase subunit B